VQDAARVRVCEAGQRVDRELDRTLLVEASLALEQATEVLAVEQLHDDVRPAVFERADRVHPHDERRVDVPGGLGLLDESRSSLRFVDELRAHDLSATARPPIWTSAAS
jgi:hypothetical protein